MAQKKTRGTQEEIKSATKATELAVSFLSRHYPFLRPVRATKANHTWVVEVDVGAFIERIAKVYIDVNTGSIIEYDVPKLETVSPK